MSIVIIANYTPNNQIDKNTTTFCQKQSGFTFASCRDGSIQKLPVWLITLRERERGDNWLFITLVAKVLW